MPRLVALLGHPVAHSLSPRMQNAAFAARALDYLYVAIDVPPERLGDAVRALPALGFAGANVTAPHKIAVAELLGSALPSVNTLVVNEDNVAAYSTDAAVLDGLPSELPVILGDGGSARAFAAALPNAKVFSRRGVWPPDASGADVVVNATSERDEVLVDVLEGQTLVDLPYPETATARTARGRVIGGLEVLVAQGAASFELWTGVPAPIEVMRRAVGLR